MKIVAAIKVVPNDEAISVAGDRTLDYSKAAQQISIYDLNAIEAAAQLAAANGGSAVAISASGSKAGDAKMKKGILSRGLDELFMIADDAMVTADSLTTANALAKLVQDNAADYDVIIAGDGSADVYAGAVSVQLAAVLGVPVVNNVTKIEVNGSVATVERTLDTEVQTLEVPLPAVLAVSPEIAEPRIAGMKDILAAGKKPATITDAAAAGAETAGVVAVEDIKAPVPAPRKCEIYGADDVAKFAEALAAAIR